MEKCSSKLQQERQEIFHDLYEGKLPKRIPIAAWVTVEFAIQYAGLDILKAQWNPEMLERAFRKVADDFYSDVFPIRDAVRFPVFYQMLGAENFVMGSNGFLQHPEISAMNPDEYEAFIKSPIDFILETVLPRIYPALDTDSISRSLIMAKAYKAHCDTVGFLNGVMIPQLEKEYGKYQTPPKSFAMTAIPMDFIADQLRGFKEISMDIRRKPEQIIEACEAVFDIMLEHGIPEQPSIYNSTFIPLHMPPYMRKKDYEKIYYPTFKRTVDGIAAAGGKAYLFLEQDWSRFIDSLYDLPENTILRFEYGDPKEIKKKLGNRHIITGLYPLGLLQTGTKQQCIDKAKELIDILAPGGKYFFDFDKNIITVDSVNIHNLHAVLETYRTCGVY
jgi:hypothetical protein